MSDAISPDSPATGSLPSRRTFVIVGGFAVVAGAAIGIAAGTQDENPTAAERPQPPEVLVSAIAHQVAIQSMLSAVTDASPGQKALLAQYKSNHASHERVLRSLIPFGSAPFSLPTASQSPTTIASIRAWERSAAKTSAATAATQTGSTAVIFACIAACETVHAELLT